MSSSQNSIIRRILTKEKFEQLCVLWEQMREIAQNEGETAVLLTQDDLLSPKSPEQEEVAEVQDQERIVILVSPEFSAFLLGKPVGDNEALYQVILTLDPQAIALFLEELGGQIASNPTLKENLIKVNLTKQAVNTKLNSRFILRILDILAPEEIEEDRQKLPSPLLTSHSQVDEVLHNQLEQERIIKQVTLQISQNLDWLVIVNMTIQQVQRLLKVDRLVIYQLEVENTTEEGNKELVDMVTYEAKASEEIPSILHFHEESCFASNSQVKNKYRQGFSLAVKDIEESTSLSPCLRSLMQKLQIKAKLVIPIIVQGNLWGFIIAHQCFTPRRWKDTDIQFLHYIAEYLAIAIYQAQSYQLLQQQKKLLESQVNQRAQELKEALLAAQAASQSKKEFINNMSHELRTPLTSVIGLSNTLLYWSKNHHNLPLEKQRKYLETIQTSGQKLLGLVNDIIDFAQAEAGKSVLNIKEFSLRSLTRSIINNLQLQAINQEINLHLDWRVDSKGDRFWGDKERIKQILVHLLDNGLKFTTAGGSVTLRVWREYNQVVFQVEDTGIGIAKNHLSLVFEKFQQLEESRRRTHGGAGLGLALTKQLVELHGGIIEVNSVVGQGSLFTVRLPSQNKSRLNRSSGISFFHKETIVLVVQDEEAATLICDLLNAGNYQVIWLIDGFTATQQIELLEPSVVIIDQQLPDVYHLSQNLKNTPTTKHIKIIVLSHKMKSKDWAYLSKNIIDDYLPLPIEANKLFQKISS